MQCTRNLSSFASNKATDGVDRTPPMSVLLATVERVSVTVTFRHELRSFDFMPGPIGLEVQYKYCRLLCTNVIPDSQASRFTELLDGAEVVAVNGRRVISLQDFQDAVVDAHTFGRVTITAACYKKGKEKLEKFYEHISGKSRSVAKSLFSGLLAGLDGGHQHDVGGMLSVTTKDTEDDEDGTIPSFRDDDEDEDEGQGEEEEEEESMYGLHTSVEGSEAAAGEGEGEGKEADSKDLYRPLGSRGDDSGCVSCMSYVSCVSCMSSVYSIHTYLNHAHPPTYTPSTPAHPHICLQ